MAVEVVLKVKEYPDGYEFDLGGFVVPNNGSVKLDDDAELSFVARHRKNIKDYFANNEAVEIKGTPKYSTKQVEEMYPTPVVEAIPSPYLEEEGTGSTTEGGDGN